MRTRFSLLELIVFVLAIAIAMAIVIPICQASREASRRTACAHNLIAITHAMFMYADVPANKNYFPTTGTKEDSFDAKPLASLGLLHNKYVVDLRIFSCPHKPVPPANVSVWNPLLGAPIHSTYGYDPGRNVNDFAFEFLGDMPGTAENSDNHGANAGQNVVLCDGIAYFSTSALKKNKDGTMDNIFKRDESRARKDDIFIRQ